MWQKSFLSLLVAFVLSGCYQNSCGLSESYWDEKTYYYDAEGRYHEVCPDNFLYKDKVLQKQQEEEVW